MIVYRKHVITAFVAKGHYNYACMSLLLFLKEKSWMNRSILLFQVIQCCRQREEHKKVIQDRPNNEATAKVNRTGHGENETDSMSLCPFQLVLVADSPFVLQIDLYRFFRG